MELRENVRVPSCTTDSVGPTKPRLAGLVSLQPASALFFRLAVLARPALPGLYILQ